MLWECKFNEDEKLFMGLGFLAGGRTRISGVNDSPRNNSQIDFYYELWWICFFVDKLYDEITFF